MLEQPSDSRAGHQTRCWAFGAAIRRGVNAALSGGQRAELFVGLAGREFLECG